jgi:hypothetical protein
VEKKPEIIQTGEFNVVNSVFDFTMVHQLKFVLHPMMLYAMIVFKLPIEKLFICYCGYSVMMLLFCFYSIASNAKLSSSLKLTFYINLLKYISLSVSFGVIWLHYKGYIHYIFPVLILIGNIVVMAIRLSLASLPRTSVDNQFGDFMESIQFLLIALKLVGFMNSSWEWTLFIYATFVYISVFTGIVGCILLPIFLGMSTFYDSDSNNRKVLLFTAWAFYHFLWKGLSFYYLYRNFLILLNMNGFRPRTKIWVTDLTLIPICYFFFFGGLINFFWFYQHKNFLSRVIALKLMVVSRNKGVKREIVEIPFDMKIMKAGTNYFKQLISTRSIPEKFDIPDSTPNNEESAQECMICCSNESNVLIRPCNHGGVCEDCMITYLGTNDSCPHCKTAITKAYVMDYDEDLKKFYGRKVLTLVK